MKDLGKKEPLTFKEYFEQYAEIAMLLKEYGLAGLLYWKAATYLPSEEGAPDVYMPRFLYCMKALGHKAPLELFTDEVVGQIGEVEAFVEGRL